MKKTYKVIIFMLILLILFPTLTSFAAGKRVIAENKYIWVYLNGERKLLADEDGYPCFGQGIDNKNVLYIPLNLICDMAGYEISPIMNTIQGQEKVYYVTLKSIYETFDLYVGQNKMNGTKMAAETFVLKGTEASGNPIIMVPLGVAKDYFGFELEVKRPVGRGVYDYCTLAINFTKEFANEDDLIDVPNAEGNKATNIEGENKYYVSVADKCYHKFNCSHLSKTYAKISEYECVYWGYAKCPYCME